MVRRKHTMCRSRGSSGLRMQSTASTQISVNMSASSACILVRSDACATCGRRGRMERVKRHLRCVQKRGKVGKGEHGQLSVHLGTQGGLGHLRTGQKGNGVRLRVHPEHRPPLQRCDFLPNCTRKTRGLACTRQRINLYPRCWLERRTPRSCTGGARRRQGKGENPRGCFARARAGKTLAASHAAALPEHAPPHS